MSDPYVPESAMIVAAHPELLRPGRSVRLFHGTLVSLALGHEFETRTAEARRTTDWLALR